MSAKETEKELFPEEKGKEAKQQHEAPPARRSNTEQAIVDTLGADPSKYKEGTREREIVEALPENIAKKRDEEEKKKK